MEITINVPEWIAYIVVIWIAFYLAEITMKIILWVIKRTVAKIAKGIFKDIFKKSFNCPYYKQCDSYNTRICNNECKLFYGHK